eukprot:scaffold54828_cov30-Tisochrysis_lutea.AAC.10
MSSIRPTIGWFLAECSMMCAPYKAGSSESVSEPSTLTLRVSRPTSARNSTGCPPKWRVSPRCSKAKGFASCSR